MSKKQIALFLKNRRKELNITVKEVIDYLKNYGITISEKTLYGWESGHSQPDSDTFIILCKIYGVESFSEIPQEQAVEHISKSSLEDKLLNFFRSMNDEGKERMIDYAEDLVSSGRYKKTYKSELAKEEA